MARCRTTADCRSNVTESWAPSGLHRAIGLGPICLGPLPELLDVEAEL